MGRPPAARVRGRHEVTLGREQAAKVHARVGVARARGDWSSFSREVDRCIDEAEGNLRTARHELRGALNPLRVQLGFLKSELLSGRRVAAEDLEPLQDLVEKMAARLEPPAPTP